MTQQKQQLYIGTSDYRDYIQNNGYFIDKTLLIKELIDSRYHVNLIPRPRRFGKSLNLSMLKYYFDYRQDDNEQLFKNYKIWQEGENYQEWLSKIPVIHFSLKRVKMTTFEESRREVNRILQEIYIDHQWLLEENILDSAEKEEFLRIKNGSALDIEYYTSIGMLAKYLYRHSGQKVLILLDEYDAAIHAGFQHGFYEEIIEIMRSLLGHTFKDSNPLWKGLITGILRIGKESIFSDMNNPGVFTILNYQYADKFGFTAEEVRQLLAYYGYEKDYSDIKYWYNGYYFGNIKGIYNPWSICNYVEKRAIGFKTYWGNTSSNDLIKQSISNRDNTLLKDSIEELLKGKTIVRPIDENIIFSDFYRDRELIYSLLTFAGYLTALGRVEFNEYELRIPNTEIRLLFQRIILDWLKIELNIFQTTLRRMVKALTNNRIAEFTEHLREIMGDTFSYFDINTEPERVYQAYLLGLLGILSDDYIIKSNRESGGGRYDILLLPQDAQRWGVIMEIKQLNKDASEKRIKTALTKALNQIVKNKYQKELTSQKVENQIHLAILFVGKEVFVKGKSLTT